MSNTATAERLKKAKERRTKPAQGDDAKPPAFWSFKRFADHFDISQSAVHKMIKAGTLLAKPMPPIGGGNRTCRRIPYSEVKRIEAGKPLPTK